MVIPIDSVFSVADAVRNARTVVADYLVDVVDRNQAIAASIRGVNELRFSVGLKLRVLTGPETAQLKRREAASRAVTCNEDRALLAAADILGMIDEAEERLRKPQPGYPDPEFLELTLQGYHAVLAELGSSGRLPN
jgi:hypothetical protein